MKTYPQIPTGFFRLLANCFAGYGTVLRTTWYLILLFSLLVDLVPAIVTRLNYYVGATVLLLMVLAGLFINAIILHLCHTVFSGNPPNFSESNKVAQARYLRFLGGYVVLVATVVLIGVFDYGLISLGTVTGMKLLFSVLSAIAVLFFLFVLFLIYFALPLIIVGNRTVLKSYENSMRLVWGNWWRTFIILFIVNAVVIVIGVLGVGLLPKDILIFGIWNFIWHFFAYSLIISTTLMLLRDLMLRKPEVR